MKLLKKIAVHVIGIIALICTIHFTINNIFTIRYKILLSGDWIIPVVLWVLFAYFLLKYIIPERTDDNEDEETESEWDDSDI